MGDENPNEYDDEAYAEAVELLVQGIQGMWDAGASAEDIRAEVAALVKGTVG